MQSKTSYFNPTLFRKNLTRFWPLWGGASLAGSLAPLTMLMSLLYSGFRDHGVHPLEMTYIYYTAVIYAVPLLSLAYAAVCALAVWHYLYNARSVSLYHALPITRKGLFCTNFLSGMAMMLIPYAVTGALAIVITLAAGLLEPIGILVTILCVIGESFFFFATATLVIFITGNPFAFSAFYLILHFFAVLAETLVSYLMSMFYFGVSQMYEGLVEFLSPAVYLVNGHINVYTQSAQEVTADGWVEYGKIARVVLENGWIIGAYTLVGVVLTALAWMLYQRRRSECAGDLVAVGWMKPIFRYGVSLCAALAGGTLLYLILWDNYQETSTAATIPMAVCMAAAGVLGYYIASMLLAKSVKVFRGSGKGALAVVVVSAALCFVIAADPAGVESWSPSADELLYVNISLFSRNSASASAGLDDPAAIQQVLEVQRAILAEKDALDDRDAYRSSGYEFTGYINLYFEKPDGRIIYRNYNLHASEEYAAQSEAVRMLNALASSPVIQESNIFGDISTYKTNIQEARLTGGYVDTVYNRETNALESLDLTQEQAKVLEDAIHRDIQAGNFGKTVFMNDYNEYLDSVYRGELQLYYNVTRLVAVGSTETHSYSTSTSLTLSIYCTETLQALKDIGVLDEPHKLLTRREYQDLRESTEIGGWGYDGYYDEAF